MAKKNDINDMADKLGIKRENLVAGLKKDTKKTEDMISKAYAFKFKGK